MLKAGMLRRAFRHACVGLGALLCVFMFNGFGLSLAPVCNSAEVENKLENELRDGFRVNIVEPMRQGLLEERDPHARAVREVVLEIFENLRFDFSQLSTISSNDEKEQSLCKAHMSADTDISEETLRRLGEEAAMKEGKEPQTITPEERAKIEQEIKEIREEVLQGKTKEVTFSAVYDENGTLVIKGLR